MNGTKPMNWRNKDLEGKKKEVKKEYPLLAQ